MDIYPMACQNPKPILTSWDHDGDGGDDVNGGSETFGSPHKSLAVLSDHTGSISCLALCGEFLLSASNGEDIIVRQHPDLRPFARFGHSGDGSVKSLVTAGGHVFSAHQDGKIRVWKVSRSSDENAFKLLTALPTRKDYLRNFMKQSSYVQTRRNHRLLWIQHADSISCLAVGPHHGLIYSGSWDKTVKIWRLSDFRCLESIRAHHDAVNAVAASVDGILYTASADATIKAWARDGDGGTHSLRGCLEGCRRDGEDVAWNSVIVCDDGRLVYGGGSDGRVMGWEVDRGRHGWRLVCDVRAHGAAVLCLCTRGDFVCTGSADRSIGVWRREEGGGGGLCRVGTIRGHEGPVKCLQASEGSMGGGFLLYSGGLDKRLRVWWVPKDYGEGSSNGQLMERCILIS